ncbi:Hypp5423 [Branchiostoma lanceolatum]|uniref:Hypp5423 protein n=1 Tax=Branchiostoma lanceolatum TaxID=7740 RepID=A0A8J9YMI6_BRALA|nr:Hypp5423 [Branchiostoma lanceolatum]
MVRWSSVVVIALVAASQDGVFGAKLNQRRSLSTQLPVKRLRHVRGKNTTMMHSKLPPLQNKPGQVKDGHVTVNDVGRAESPQKEKQKDLPQNKSHDSRPGQSRDVEATNTDMKEQLVSKETCTSPRCQVTPFCSYNHSEISCSCAEEGENETEAEVNCTLYNLAAIFDVFHEDATVTSVCVETRLLSVYELDCHIKGVEGLTYVIRVDRWGEATPGGLAELAPGWEEAKHREQGMEHLTACLLQLQLQSQEVLIKDDWMDSTLKTAITIAGIIISVFMIIFIFYSCSAL